MFINWRTYPWNSSFLQNQVRKHRCSCSHRQHMFHCFHTGWDNNHRYLIREKKLLEPVYVSIVIHIIYACSIVKLVHAFISSRLDYCNSPLYGIPEYQKMKLQRVLNVLSYNTSTRWITLVTSAPQDTLQDTLDNF